MIRRTKWEFEFPMSDEMTVADFRALISVINNLGHLDGEIYGEAITPDAFRIVVETVTAT